MTSILEIEEAIKGLPPEEYGKLRRWLEDYELELEAMASSSMVAEMLDAEDEGDDQMVPE